MKIPKRLETFADARDASSVMGEPIMIPTAIDISRTVLAVRESLGDKYDRSFDDVGSILSANSDFARLADNAILAPNSTDLRRNLRNFL
jgi:hypothetical protein